MLTITSRLLREVSYDPAEQQFLGRVELAFQDNPKDPPHVARLTVAQVLPHRTRFAQVEAALLDAAERELRLRLARMIAGPVNIFAEPPAAPARMAA